jgi:Telomere resolvase
MDISPDNWLDLAASHGSTKWVQHFIRSYLPQLKDQRIAPEVFAQTLEEELQTRLLTTAAQQKNYRSNVVQAIKSIASDHSAEASLLLDAIALVSPTAEEYRELNDAQRGKLADREIRYFTSDQAQTLVDRATALLESAEWSDVGAGLAVLIGRRISEILLSRFSLKATWSLSFSEMAKKADTDGLTIEIPTLAPANVVLSAIERLQKALRIEDLKLSSLSPKMAKQTVNGRFSEPVAAKCVEHFSDLIPARSDRENLYTHIFRACYATIATHWFCPPHVPEHHFKAEIQGHFTLTKDGKKLPNYSARANYDDYAISTSDGNRDGRLGIKLGTLPGLEVIEAFTFSKEKSAMETVANDKDRDKDEKLNQEEVSDAPDSPETTANAKRGASIENHSFSPTEITPMTKPTAKPKTKRPELYAEDWEDMVRLMGRRGVTGSTGEVFHALIQAFKSGESEQQQQQVQTVSELTSSLSWFTDRIDQLEQTCMTLQQEREQPQAAQSATHQLNQLRTENAQLTQELHQTQSQLQGIQKLLGMESNGGVAPVQSSNPTPTTLNHAPVAQAQFVSDSHTTPTTSTQPREPKSEALTRRSRGETEEKLNQIIDALMSWNTSQEDSDTQLRISIPTIKGLASAMGANYQRAIQEVLKQRAGELDDHHSRLMIGARHNAGVTRKQEVLQSIARDYLGLENWHQVKYQG